MTQHRSIFGRVVFCSLVFVLLCGIVSSELPELLSLTDNTSNDFTFRKASGQERTSTLGAAVHKSVPLDKRNSECAPCTNCALMLAATKTISSDLFVLHSVLRR
jgi:hypothetical protein